MQTRENQIVRYIIIDHQSTINGLSDMITDKIVIRAQGPECLSHFIIQMIWQNFAE